MTEGAPLRREKAADLDLERPPEVETPGGETKPRARRSRSRRGGSRSGGSATAAVETPPAESEPARSEDGAKGGGAPKTDGAPRPRRSRSRTPRKPEEQSKAEGREEAGRAEGNGASKSEGRNRGRSRGRRKPRRKASGSAVERTMLVHADEKGTQIAVLEAQQIVEHYVTRPDDRSYVGNVYLGKVQNVLPGMEASFVDIGEARNGVLYAGEVGIAGDEGDEVPRIETVLKAGQPILVQVTKDPMGAKGARLTALVSLAGRHLVLVPRARSLGVSRRLSDSERERLRSIAQDLMPEEHGLIVRTAAEGASREDLEKDLERLAQSWKDIEARSKSASAPALLYSEPELELRVIRDLFNRDVDRCIVDDKELHATLREYIRATTPDLDARLELFDGRLPIFEEFRVLEQIRKSLDRKVWLPSGGHLVIDRTEAMTVVDVNTGKFVGKSNLEETVFRTNKEAATEISRQLRLRDIGGIIVIDFIDMEDATNRDELIRAFRRELDSDRTRTQVFDITPLGLVQMTRKNVSTGIVEAFSDPCPTCEGRGILIHDVD